VSVRNVHERLSAFAVDLEALRMRAELYAPRDLAARRVEDRQSTRAIAHDDLSGLRIDPHVVRVISKRNRAYEREGAGVEKANCSVAGRRNRELVAIGQIGEALRFLQSVDPARLAGREIDDVDRSVAKLRHKEAPVWKVNCKMINAPPATLGKAIVRSSFK
jgi:hypothetical protein